MGLGSQVYGEPCPAAATAGVGGDGLAQGGILT